MGLLSISGASDRSVPKTTIYVDKSGSGNYSSVQEAIDSIPDDNNQWIHILIKRGTYREKVKVPRKKQYVFLHGDGRDMTTIEYGDSGNAIEAATFQLYADNFVASDITFKNSYSAAISNIHNTSLTWAPAALLVADKVSFHRCGFHGIQDTLGDAQGRHYFEKCYISGAIDFIWGHGQSVYKHCLLETTASTIGQDGYITAQGRQGADDPSAFVFIRCWVKGEGHTYLGRAYRRYSRVLFYHTRMTDVVVPAGWSSWNYRGHEEDITFAEVRCTGEGASKSGRVKWMKDLPSQEVQYFLSNDFISQDGWLKNQPRYIEIQTPRY
ncbi:probable pectinesterase 55 [Eucalyptus grandis]|uniref:probable pectinesterase 55 n=1 Tax=Eucalyptus grandis TaxID=71139 RepID=UPI00192EF286|nr:probable pectinesterase 55 [Eucalyptus grandis]